MYYCTRRRLSALCLMGSAAIAAMVYYPTSLNGQQAIDFQVDKANQRLEMVVNSSRILTLDTDVPRVLVANPDVMKVVPLSPNQVQISAVRPGVTQINLWDRDGAIRSVDVIVYADARQLEMVLKSEFPKAAIRVRPIGKSVLLTGTVSRPEAVTRIVEIAETFYPKVINNVTVGGVHQVTLHVKVMEVSRTKLRSIGFDWGNLSGNGDFVVQSAAGLVANAASGGFGVAGTGLDTIRFGIVENNNSFFGFLEALRANNVIKILAEPTLTAVSGRPAYFHEGGEFPILVPSGLGTTGVQYKQFGTRVDFVPIVLGNGNIRLEVRPHVSEVDPTRGVDLEGVTVPGLRDRAVETAVEMRSGQTLAIAGLIQTRTEAENIGLPFLSDLPWAGALFRRVREDVNEIELLVIVRPELVAPLDPHQVPMLGPGERTTSPSDIDLFARGYLEVPKCCPDAKCQLPQGYTTAPVGVGGQTLPGEVLPSTMVNQQPAYTTPIGSGYQGSAEGVFQGNDPGFTPAPTEYPLLPPTTSAPTVPGSAPQGPAPAYGAPVSIPATTGPYYPANAASRYRQVRANVPVAPDNKTNVFGPSGYDELDY